jgi:hypothetical protein
MVSETHFYYIITSRKLEDKTHTHTQKDDISLHFLALIVPPLFSLICFWAGPDFSHMTSLRLLGLCGVGPIWAPYFLK